MAKEEVTRWRTPIEVGCTDWYLYPERVEPSRGPVTTDERAGRRSKAVPSRPDSERPRATAPVAWVKRPSRA